MFGRPFLFDLPLLPIGFLHRVDCSVPPKDKYGAVALNVSAFSLGTFWAGPNTSSGVVLAQTSSLFRCVARPLELNLRECAGGWSGVAFVLRPSARAMFWCASVIRSPIHKNFLRLSRARPMLRLSRSPSSHPISSKPPLMAGSRTAWALPVSPTCLPNGRGSARCSAFRRADSAFEPSLYQCQSPPSGNAIFQGRDKDPETAPVIQWAECRDKMRAESPPVRGYSH